MSRPAETEDIYRDDDATETIGLGCALELFSEVEEVMKMIDNIRNVYTSLSGAEHAYQRFSYLLTLYQEQPHLLDPHLDSMIGALMQFVRSAEYPMELKHEAFKYLHIIMKVRGYKLVIRHLPHEVSDIEPVLKILESQDPNDVKTWQTRFVTLLWLSIIVMIPFHMSRLDSFDPSENCADARKTVMTRVLELCKEYIIKDFQVAAFLAARFLTRSDVKEIHLPSFLDWAHNILGSTQSSFHAQCGVMAAIAAILKHGKREDLLPYAPTILKRVIESKYRESQNSLARKYGVKIVQRVGLTFLKTRVAVWRYQRGCRSLLDNLSAGDSPPAELALSLRPPPPPDPEVAEDFEVPEEVEEVIEELMQALRDLDIAIRWSAAKGVGRVTGRLPKDLADEVVGSVLELFNPRELDGAWHGGCLALAELGRRGLLLPERLNDVVPLVLKALVYDEPRGYTSVGAHIRDAACFVCWAFARAYDTDVLLPFVKDISGALLVVSSFDREINCRRAASAAFQENVGRQGTFPHGIDILTTADYFTVGVRTNAFLTISVYIAQFEEYTHPMINHLVERKVDHWDPAIRELTAKALHNLTSRAPTYMAHCVLPALLEKTRLIDLNARHGAVLAIGDMLHALSLLARADGGSVQTAVVKHGHASSVKLLLWACENAVRTGVLPAGAEVIEEICQLVPSFRQRQQFRGLGGELMKQACAHLIEKCSLSVMPFHGREIIADWQALLDDCLLHETLTVRTCAAAALPAFFSEYYRTHLDDGSWRVNEFMRDEVVLKYTQQLQASSEVTRMGFALALGSLPDFMLLGQLDTVIPALIACSRITKDTPKWAESRRDALKALAVVCVTVGADPSNRGSEHSYLKHTDSLFDCFLNGLTEYTLDSRGDIGAWVREAAMAGLQVLTSLVLRADPELLTPPLMRNIMASIAQQAMEKIDRTRAQAGRAFSALLHSQPPLPNIPYHEELLQIFPAAACEEQIKWLFPADTFPRFTQMLRFPPYTYHVLLGTIVSVGGLSESLVKHSSLALISFFKSTEEDLAEMTRLCDTVVDIFHKHQFNDRVVVPLFGFLDRLLGSGCLACVLKDPESQFAPEILRLVKAEIAKTRDLTKMTGSIDVLCQLIQVNGSVSRGALVQLGIFLCNRFLGVRRLASNRFYEALLVYGEESVIPPENLDEVMALLSDTNWDEEVAMVRPVRNRLCELMAVPVPKVVSATAARRQ